MESRMYSSVKHLVCKNLNRSLVVGVLYTIALILQFPIGSLLGVDLSFSSAAASAAVSSLLSAALSGVSWLRVIFAMIAATVGFGYLDSSRSVYMMQSFPVTRSRLFSAGILSGLLLGLIPCMVALLGAGLLALSIPVPLGSALLTAFAVYTLEYLFYFGLAVFCMMITGTVVAAVLVYGFLNVAVFTYSVLALEFLEPMLYGFSSSIDITLLSPFLKLAISYPSSVSGLWSKYGLYLAAAAAAGIALSAAALPLYHRRNPETAGDFIACRPFRPVFKYLFTLLFTLAIGALLCVLILGTIDPHTFPISTLLCLLAAAAIGYYLAEMILQKTRRVFRKKALVGLGVFCLLLCCAYIVPLLDLIGYESRIPLSEDVECAELTVRNQKVTLDDPAGIDFVTDLHSKIIGAYDPRDKSDVRYENIFLTYTLKNGTTLSRSYVWVNSPNGELPYADRAPVDFSTRYVEQLFRDCKTISLDYWDESYRYISMEFSDENSQKLMDAMLSDVAEGSIDFLSREYIDHNAIYFYCSDHVSPVFITEETRHLNALLDELGISFSGPDSGSTVDPYKY